MKPEYLSSNIKLEYHERIPSKLDYMRVLSRSWASINIGIHLGGTNERKYDYAAAGTVVFSDFYGARGDLLPFEYTYVDSYDLAAKLEVFLELGKERITEMGIENSKRALFFAENCQTAMLQKLISF